MFYNKSANDSTSEQPLFLFTLLLPRQFVLAWHRSIPCGKPVYRRKWGPFFILKSVQYDIDLVYFFVRSVSPRTRTTALFRKKRTILSQSGPQKLDYHIPVSLSALLAFNLSICHGVRLCTSTIGQAAWS